MKNRALLFIVVVVALVMIFFGILLIWGVGLYNNLVSSEQNVIKQWAQVENQYQRRADLIPNLVNTVKGYANFEKQVLTDVVEARAKVGQFNITPEVLNDPQSFQKFQAVQGELSSALTRLMAVVENYPELKANENFLQLQAQLEGTENRISVERKRYNETVQEYNTSIKKFPSAIIASIFGFREKQYFSAAPGTESPPKVEF
jgi:LemA protein